jgi:hypothetical protein
MNQTMLKDTYPNTIDLNDKGSRQKLSKMVLQLFSHWGLSTADQLELLGLSPNSRAILTRYQKGTAIPSSRDMLDRIGWLFSIHKSLRLLYPKNDKIRYSWVKRRNKILDNHSPLEIMRQQGLIGIARVSRYLDHLRGI